MEGLNTKKGMSIVEVLVAVGVILIIVLGIMTSFSLLLKHGLSNVERTQATYLAEEGIEAIKFMRDVDYNQLSALTLDTEYYFDFTGSVWTSTTTESYIDGQFLRTFTLGEVRRDANDDISQSGTIDTGALLVEVDVKWWDGTSTTTEHIATYLTNLFGDE